MEEKDILDGVNLRYASDKKAGITRKARGKSFIYYDKHGVKISDEKVTARINKLVIPPAWKKVWICQYKNGHMQATGIDNKGRKQYRYHQLWNELKQQKKFSHVLDFAESLPKIRGQREKDLQLQGLPKEKVVATVVWLLENTMIRVGNDEYKEENNSYGLTTIANKHAKVEKSTITFSFVGKSSVKHKVDISHKKIANIVRRCQDLPGQDLFGYEGDDGKIHDITSYDINEYLKHITGQDITAKDFRTWGGTVAAAGLLDKAGVSEKVTDTKKNIVTAVMSVAEHLRNKPATCKKYYIHPTIFEAYTNGYVVSNIKEKLQHNSFKKIDGLRESENDVVCLLKIMLREGERSLHAKI